MDKYIISNGTFYEVHDDNLMHRRSRSSSYKKNTKKNFKYVAKIDLGKSTRYFYTKEEYNAYLKGNKQTKTSEVTSSKTGKQSASSASAKLAGKYSNTVDNLIKLGEKAIKNVIDTIFNPEKKRQEEAAKIREAEAKQLAEEAAKKKAQEEARKKAEAEKKAKEEAANRQAEEIAKRNKDADAISDKNSPKSFDDLHKKDREYTKEEDQAIINTNYVGVDEDYVFADNMTDEEKKEYESLVKEFGIDLYEYHINCMSCTLAYDMRRRGYDVEAAPYDLNETWQPLIETIGDLYKGVTPDDWFVSELSGETPHLTDPNYWDVIETQTQEMYDKVSDEFDKMTDGAYGQFCVHWDSGGGHSIAWEKEAGKITLRDCQSNKTYDFEDIKHSDFYYSVETVFVLRTDDKEFSDGALKRVRNADHVEEVDKFLERMRKKYRLREEDE